MDNQLLLNISILLLHGTRRISIEHRRRNIWAYQWLQDRDRLYAGNTQLYYIIFYFI